MGENQTVRFGTRFVTPLSISEDEQARRIEERRIRLKIWNIAQ